MYVIQCYNCLFLIIWDLKGLPPFYNKYDTMQFALFSMFNQLLFLKDNFLKVTVYLKTRIYLLYNGLYKVTCPNSSLNIRMGSAQASPDPLIDCQSPPKMYICKNNHCSLTVNNNIRLHYSYLIVVSLLMFKFAYKVSIS